jgi:hypothetical protein
VEERTSKRIGCGWLYGGLEEGDDLARAPGAPPQVQLKIRPVLLNPSDEAYGFAASIAAVAMVPRRASKPSLRLR